LLAHFFFVKARRRPLQRARCLILVVVATIVVVMIAGVAMIVVVVIVVVVAVIVVMVIVVAVSMIVVVVPMIVVVAGTDVDTSAPDLNVHLRKSYCWEEREDGRKDVSAHIRLQENARRGEGRGA
jgi:hypothetical protein